MKSIQSDDFELFELTQRFAQDRAQLDARWKDLQREVHPDKFAGQDAAAQRVAMQWSVRVNEAYQRLKDPLKRAAYLCELNGAPVNAENNTAMPAAFLMQQMQWREELDEAKSAEDIQQISQQVQLARRGMLENIERLIDLQHAFDEAVEQVRALMFVERFEDDVNTRLDQIETF
ncbi:Fe-S protein assembly co-chaperone HscB [Rhodoferax antarcticus]|uniref:Co-chaperone protein HscB homolog n=1 Tax=Rhodoferax antarcticus ANT.BR TaxID=1111071 RepID=A0A1Q8YFA2_9BURK|nr:Fe-S protein assembly co-chaperone HscB [Rhodoferax antarcticus]APW46459.1 Fe-S protein assembly co-chaperone HscB [Rhodoferax antarcticus]OLP06724.1 fe-S protein assembly co-chaperone HscB [Rhodoferax antarcticus ANT.BR]